jgi:hypothetical protein
MAASRRRHSAPSKKKAPIHQPAYSVAPMAPGPLSRAAGKTEVSLFHALDKGLLAEDLKVLFAFPRAALLKAPLKGTGHKVVIYEACPAMWVQPNDIATELYKKAGMLPSPGSMIMGHIIFARDYDHLVHKLDKAADYEAAGIVMPPPTVPILEAFDSEDRGGRYGAGPVRLGSLGGKDLTAVYPALTAQERELPRAQNHLAGPIGGLQMAVRFDLLDRLSPEQLALHLQTTCGYPSTCGMYPQESTSWETGTSSAACGGPMRRNNCSAG